MIGKQVEDWVFKFSNGTRKVQVILNERNSELTFEIYHKDIKKW